MARWRIRLRGVSPQLEGKHWESDQQLRVGRFENLEIVLNDPSISRKHAEIVASEQGWVLRDLGSTNGTFLNGIRVGRSDRRLRQRDVVQFGNLVLVVQVLEEDAVASHDSDPPSGTMQVQATTSQSWEKALESIAFKGEQRRPRAEDRLLTLLRASQHLVNIASLEMLLRSILDDAVRALDAQRAAIILFDEKRKELVLRSVSTGEREGGGRIYYSRSLAQRCFTKSESLLCKDVATSPELLVANSIADGAMASIICAVLRSPRRRLGVLHLDRGPLQEAFNQEDLSLADALAASVSAGIESAQLMEKQRELFLQTVTALAQAVELRDRYTGGHTQRVTDYAIILADALNLGGEEHQAIRVGTPLHDIGKIGIDDSILRKPGRLTETEFETMKLHTTMGAAIIESIPDLLPVLPIVRNHHEAWNGTGYPDQMAGEKIPYLARIVAVADTFDAMTSSRPYRPALDIDEAFEEIRAQAGLQFDPAVVQAFLNRRDLITDARNERLAAEQADAELFGSIEEEAADTAGPPTAAIKSRPADEVPFMD
ncbi:MAG TPA: FHA domain-containing protein [Gemmatales bacterium]|nr:FHA domain-containing protein [Gemmatales bacterium]